MANALICPSCRSRNKQSWEFCARCGEPLDAAAVEAASPASYSSPRDGGPRGDFASFWLTLTLALLAGTAVVACRQIAKEPPPPPPSPGVFTFGGPQPAPPPAASPVPVPGLQQAEEGRRLVAQGRTAEAIALFEQAAGADPRNAEYRQLLAQALWDTGSRDAALRSFSDAAGLDPSRYRQSYALALEMAGQTDAAVEQLRQVVSEQPQNEVAAEALGRIFYDRGDYSGALPLLERSAARTRDPVVLQKLAYAVESTGDRDRAISVYREVLAAEPRADVARGLLAENLFQKGQSDDAVALLRDGLARNPDAPLLQRGLGSVLERNGKAAEAAVAYREYARLAPNAPDAVEIAARAQRLEGSPGPRS